MHDFDIRLSDGRVIALEVTSSTISERVAMWDTIEQLDWFVTGITRSWSITLQAADRGEGGTRVRDFYRRGPSLLKVLEQELGSASGDVFGSPPALSQRASEVMTTLRQLGVRHGSPLDTTGHRPYISVGTYGESRWPGGGALNQTVEDALAANAKKLGRSAMHERHLWVWVDSTDSESVAEMYRYSVPRDTPTLYGRADEVWAALWLKRINPETNIGALWHLQSAGPWELHSVPAVRRYREALGG